MREILFRAKRLDNGRWIEGYYLKSPHQYAGFLKDYISVSKYDEEKEEGFDELFLIDPETVCQYTGLTDKNGVKIFEGDVVKAKQGKYEDVATVGFENGSFMVCPIFSKIYERNTWEYWYNDWDLEVIGNIFDNPELMKDGEADE